MDIEEKIKRYLVLKDYQTTRYWIKELLKIQPQNAYGQYSLAKVLYEQGNFMLAIDRLKFILSIRMQQVEKYGFFLIYQLLAYCYFATGKNKEAARYFLEASQFATETIQSAQMYSNYLFISNYFYDLTNEELAAQHKKYNDIFIGTFQYTHKKQDHKKIRIGYISPDFRRHIVVYFSYQLLARYNKNRFEITCYANGPEDAVTDQLKVLVDHWQNISNLTAEAAAKIIYEDHIDILFDLSGHTANNCLPILARKPAPIQISGIGYFNTTGLSSVDYFLTDINCDPVGENDEYFTEKFLRLPHSHFCYTPPDIMLNITNDYRATSKITFGSFNNLSKISDELMSSWLQIIEKVPNSKLLLKSPHFDKQKDQDELHRRAMNIGFKAEQIEIRPASLEYLSEYEEVDIALDTYPYPGGGTTCEALFMGVPVVSLIGSRHGSRFGYSILKNIGLEELAAKNEEEYVEIAVNLASDKELLYYLHKNLRSIMQNSFLMDGGNYIREVEAIYEKIWDTWINSEEKI